MFTFWITAVKFGDINFKRGHCATVFVIRRRWISRESSTDVAETGQNILELSDPPGVARVCNKSVK